MAKTLPVNMTTMHPRAIKSPGLHRDRGDGAAKGLFLQVTKSAANGADDSAVVRSWIFRYTSPTRRTQKDKPMVRWMGLGALSDRGLGEARDKAREYRKQVLEGIDPIDQRERDEQARRVEAAKMKTFREVADEFMREKDKGADSAWNYTFEHYTAVINSLPVAAIDTQLVTQVLRPHWKTKTETMSRVRGRMEAVLDYAKVFGYRTGEN